MKHLMYLVVALVGLVFMLVYSCFPDTTEDVAQ